MHRRIGTWPRQASRKRQRSSATLQNTAMLRRFVARALRINPKRRRSAALHGLRPRRQHPCPIGNLVSVQRRKAVQQQWNQVLYSSIAANLDSTVIFRPPGLCHEGSDGISRQKR